MENWKNEYGLLIFKHRYKDLILRRAYYWIDRALIMKGSQVLKDLKFSEIDKKNWVVT